MVAAELLGRVGPAYSCLRSSWRVAERIRSSSIQRPGECWGRKHKNTLWVRRTLKSASNPRFVSFRTLTRHTVYPDFILSGYRALAKTQFAGLHISRCAFVYFARTRAGPASSPARRVRSRFGAKSLPQRPQGAQRGLFCESLKNIPSVISVRSVVQSSPQM